MTESLEDRLIYAQADLHLAQVEIKRLKMTADSTAESFAQRLTEADYRAGLAQQEVERLRAEVLAVINSFDNRDWSATPDQRDVIDPIRRVLSRPKGE